MHYITAGASPRPTKQSCLYPLLATAYHLAKGEHIITQGVYLINQRLHIFPLSAKNEALHHTGRPEVDPYREW